MGSGLRILLGLPELKIPKVFLEFPNLNTPIYPKEQTASKKPLNSGILETIFPDFFFFFCSGLEREPWDFRTDFPKFFPQDLKEQQREPWDFGGHFPQFFFLQDLKANPGILGPFFPILSCRI